MYSRETRGMLLGLLGVLIFSLTLPMTRIIIEVFSPLLAGLGRSLTAALPAAALLWWCRVPRPNRAQLKRLFVIALSIAIGFPVISAWAMQTMQASHGAIVNGLQPLLVALYAAWLARERPSKAFWSSALLGSALVLTFAVRAGDGALQTSDLLMFVAISIGAFGYAEGARLAHQMGGWQVICWVLVVAAPFLVLPVGWLAWQHHLVHPGSISPHIWFAFGYVTLFSQLLGFFAWYAGLALGGIARVGQVQLLQIFFTIAFSALFFGETVAPSTWLFAAAVIATVMLSRKAAVNHAPHSARAG